MDFTTLTEHFVLVVLVACLVVGYIIKHATFLNKIPNTDIPCILAVIGAVLNGVVSGFSVESIVYGAVMGLASTGLHQAFTQFIEGKNNISTEEDDADGVHDTSDQIMWFCTIVGGIWGFLKIIKELRKPNEDMKAEVQKHTELLDKDNRRMKQCEDANQMILKCLLVIINHEITGNGIEKMKETRDKLQDFLVDN